VYDGGGVLPHQRITFAFSLALVLSALSGCSQGSPARSTLSQAEIDTFLAQTVAAVQRKTQSALPTPTPEIIASDTPTVSPTDSQPPTNTPKPASNPASCYSTGVIDVTITDNWVTTKEDHFIKTWRFTNFGTCTWTKEYSLVFASGERMGAPDSVALTNDPVPPGGSVDVSVTLQSPSKSGTYQGNFQIRAADGKLFGLIWVKIKVVDVLATSSATP
jgi:hypothetical protein